MATLSSAVDLTATDREILVAVANHFDEIVDVEILAKENDLDAMDCEALFQFFRDNF